MIVELMMYSVAQLARVRVVALVGVVVMIISTLSRAQTPAVSKSAPDPTASEAAACPTLACLCGNENPSYQGGNPCYAVDLPRPESIEPRYYTFLFRPNTNSISRGFVYRMTLRNGGEKVVRAVEWDYIFIDGETQAEVARHHFYSETKVRPHQRKAVVEYSSSPPTRVITVRALSQPESNRFIEKVVIRRIAYGDGSVWVQPFLPPVNFMPSGKNH
ncbi:MAG: hypothetical protein M3410_07165 [Acidobacteriota bacterium]|nr:hypothetical protein [Acidobacteriota bacterium]